MLNIRFLSGQIGNSILPSLHLAIETCALPVCVNIQVRHRKPYFLGRAPSKGRDHFKKFLPTAKDQKENAFLYQNYNYLLKSLVAAFQEELVMKDHNHIAEDEGQWNEEAYHKMCMEYNDAENTRLQEIRNQRVNDERKESEVKRAELVKEEAAKNQEKEEEVKSLVMETIADSAEWLTLENMEEKIIEAIDNPVNFNFAVNRKGVIVKRTALVLPPDESSYEAMEVRKR